MSSEGNEFHQISHLLGIEAPRYTSYPPANHFKSSITGGNYYPFINRITPNTSISLYVHIPFCRELCWFCGCHTKATRRYEPVRQYVEFLLQELDILKFHAGSQGRLTHIHFGGGSPSLLESADLEMIVAKSASVFNKDPSCEMDIELDPRTVTKDKIQLYKDLGFTRVSLGIQDFDPDVQIAINRVQPFQMVASVMNYLRTVGLKQINFDLIYGLPYQTSQSFRTTLEQTLELDPDRIALFSYAHLPDFKKHQRLIKNETLPSEHDKLSLYMMACDLLTKNGYVPVGMDHFAKQNDKLAIALETHDLKRNFHGYVTDSADILIGIGTSAISQTTGGYFQNAADLAKYKELISKKILPVSRGWLFQDDDLSRKQIIDDLMCFMSVDLEDICHSFNLNLSYFQSELQKLQDQDYRNIISCDSHRLSVITPYRMAARIVASVFDSYRTTTQKQYSKVT